MSSSTKPQSQANSSNGYQDTQQQLLAAQDTSHNAQQPLVVHPSFVQEQMMQQLPASELWSDLSFLDYPGLIGSTNNHPSAAAMGGFAAGTEMAQHYTGGYNQTSHLPSPHIDTPHLGSMEGSFAYQLGEYSFTAAGQQLAHPQHVPLHSQHQHQQQQHPQFNNNPSASSVFQDLGAAMVDPLSPATAISFDASATAPYGFEYPMYGTSSTQQQQQHSGTDMAPPAMTSSISLPPIPSESTFLSSRDIYPSALHQQQQQQPSGFFGSSSSAYSLPENMASGFDAIPGINATTLNPSSMLVDRKRRSKRPLSPPQTPHIAQKPQTATSLSGTEEVHICPHPGCNKQFPRYYSLKSHLLCHSTERPHVCQSCNAAFARKHDLQRHMRTLHNENRPFKCPKCQQGFRRATSFWRHLLEEQQNIKDPSSVAFFQQTLSKTLPQSMLPPNLLNMQQQLQQAQSLPVSTGASSSLSQPSTLGLSASQPGTTAPVDLDSVSN